jgi:hypothetical protein
MWISNVVEWNVALKININIHQFHFVDYLHARKPSALIDVITKTEKLTGHHRRVSS